MLFNSHEFIFVFLPVAVAGFFLLGTVSKTWALRWIIITSLFFYAWWRPLNVLLIAPSILINFGLARVLQRLGDDEKRSYACTMVLWLGIAFNVVFLGYFKYIDFARGTINDVFGTNLVLTHVILPLGISFITFQKIAFLLDVNAGRVKSFTFQDYCLFVLFFPQLIAGPIVHYREMMPQFHAAPCRFDKINAAVGLTLLSFGLFKKTVLADRIAPLVTPIYEQAAAGNHITLLLAWMAAIGFTLQIYFDFSGYTDMALGIARFFGIRLPQNFDSPLKSSSIIDFWLRWHMTLTRFLTAYIFNPLTLWLTRRRLAKGRSLLSARNATIGAFIYLLMVPLLVTMFISGLWHGAGYGFIFWGLLHGFYLTVNHAWRIVVRPRWPVRLNYDRLMKPVGFVLTFVSVCVGMVFFRSSTMASATDLVRGMVGLNGVTLPEPVFASLGSLGVWLHTMGVASQPGGGQNLTMMVFWITILMFIALACPNTLQVLARFEPALGTKPRPARILNRWLVEWNASLAWATGISIVAAIGILSLGGPSEFLYWQF
jgi:D-alanyl-lipoteichoic acid acyltransferase DltB (MBOAT superfamily)